MNSTQKEIDRGGFKIVAVCFIAYMSIYIGRKNFSVCMSEMIADGIINKTFGGSIGTAFLICYAMGQFISGQLGDKISPKYMISTGLLGAGIINILMGINHYAPLFIIFWGMCGLFCSMLWSPVIRAVSSWTSERVSIAAGASLSATIPIGSILSYLICAAAIRFIGWRGAFEICGSILIFCAVGIFISFIRVQKYAIVNEDSVKEKVNQEKSSHVHKISLITLFISTGLLFTVGGIVFNGILKDGLDLWLPTYLKDVYISDASTVSFICTALPIINIIGVYFAKFLYARFIHSEMMTSAVMFSISAMALGGVLILTTIIGTAGNASIFQSALAVLLLAMTSACMLGANTMFLTFIPFKFSKVGRASSVTGTLNSISYAAAALSGVTAGTVAESFGWTGAFIMFIAVSIIGAVICFVSGNKMKFPQ